jgi:hypothetical protein
VVAELVQGPALESALDGEPEQPVEVAEARFAEASAADAAVSHRVYLAIVANSGSSVDPTDTIQDRLAAGTAWWQAESGATFTRAGTARYTSSLGAGARCGFGYESQIWSDAAKQFPGVSFTAPGNHLVVVVDAACPGVGTGTWTSNASMASGGSVLMTEESSVFQHTFAHEMGHNLGLEHANLESDEYWDLYSPMGQAIRGSGAPALDSEYRDQLGITDAGEIDVVPSGTSRTSTLSPRGGMTGLRGLEVRSGGTSYWVEWRSGGGRDALAYYPREANGTTVQGSNYRYPTGVTVSARATGGRGMTSLKGSSAGTLVRGSRTTGESYVNGSLTITVDAITSSGATVTVANGAPLPTVQGATPAIAGTPEVGVRLTAQPGTWTDGAALTYQWLADGSALSGATATSFTPGAAQRGKRISVRVRGAKTGHTATTLTSKASAPVAYGTLRTSTPRISGTPKVGRRLSVVRGTWTAGTSFSYRWYANGKAIAKATRSTYTPTKGVKGKRISVRVTGRKAGYATVTTTSARTAAVR